MKLFAKYNRVNLTVTAILFVLAAIAYYFIINTIFVRELDEELDNYKQKIETFAGQRAEFPEKGALEDLEVTYEPTDKASSAVHYQLVNRYNPEDKRVENYRQLSYTQPLGKLFYKVTIAKPLEGILLLTRTIVYSTITMLLTIIFTSLFLNHILLRRLWKPFYDSIKTIKSFRLSASNPTRFPATRIDEFSFLNESLSQTMEAAKNDYRLLKEFTENASHEIQTPLAIIRSKMDLLIQEENLSEKQIELLKSAYGAVKRISRLNQSLLLLAKIENHQYAAIEKIDLKKEISDKMDQFHEFWENDQIRYSSSLEESFITANPDLTDILLNNLLSNAGLHNRKGGEIIIQLASDQLIIQNTGSLQALDKKRIFRRFYKEESYSSHNGLGLSIIKQICEQSGIHIQYSFNDIFHIFTLTWPASKD